MNVNDCYVSVSHGNVREITFVDLHTNRFTTIIYLYGHGEHERVYTEIPIGSFVFDEMYSLHRWKVDHIVLKLVEEDKNKSFDDGN